MKIVKFIVKLLVWLAVLGGAGASLAAPTSPDFTYRRASVLATRAADEAGRTWGCSSL